LICSTLSITSDNRVRGISVGSSELAASGLWVFEEGAEDYALRLIETEEFQAQSQKNFKRRQFFGSQSVPFFSYHSSNVLSELPSR
jgi:PleD family two-component response regulator